MKASRPENVLGGSVKSVLLNDHEGCCVFARKQERIVMLASIPGQQAFVVFELIEV